MKRKNMARLHITPTERDEYPATYNLHKKGFSNISRIRLILLLIFLLISAGAAYYHFKQVKTTTIPYYKVKEIPKRVYLFGVDGLDPKITLDLCNRGLLPNINTLLQNGTYGILKSEEPMISPALWATIFTGKSRQQHGIYNFVIKKEQSYNIHLNDITNWGEAAVWDIAYQKGITTGIIRPLCSFPAPEVKGFFISDQVVNDYQQGCYPTDLAPLAEQLYHQAEVTAATTLQPFNLVPKSQMDPLFDDYPIIKKHAIGDLYSALLTRELLKNNPVQLVIVYFQGLDRLCHQLWHLCYPYSLEYRINDLPNDTRKERAIIENYYRFIDYLIGDILASDNQKNKTVIINSDHGFQTRHLGNTVYFDLNHLLQEMGLAKVQPGARPRTMVWSETKAFNFHDHYCQRRSIFVNLKGREANGTIAEADFIDFRKKLAKDLQKIVTEKGTKLFSEVIENEYTIGWGERQLPDIEVVLNTRAYFDKTVVIEGEQPPKSIPMSELLWYFADVTGNHRIQGTIIISGLGVNKERIIKNADIYDITPTILNLLGLPQSQDMPGRFLADVFLKDFLEISPDFVIPSYKRREYRFSMDQKKVGIDKESKEDLLSVGYLK